MLARMNHPVARRMMDARLQKGDPTGTADIRRRYRRLVDIRWRKFTSHMRNAIISQDMLGLDPSKQTALSLAMMALPKDGKIEAFQRLVDKTLEMDVLEKDTSYLDPMITVAYNRAVTRAVGLSQSQAKPPHPENSIHAIQQLVLVEMQGVAEAASQKIMRAASEALLFNRKPAQLMQQVMQVIEKVGVERSRLAVETYTVRAHAFGTLDQFEAAGIQSVGIVPEQLPALRKQLGLDAKAEIENPRRKGPGSRIGREELPSASTIGRIRRAERKIEKLKLVNVLTAGDDRVCPVCEDIEDDGPYSINTARSLIPAHPRCRCAFVPA